MLSLADCLQLACLLEATARKPGNVHPQASFDDCRYVDFLVSAAIVAPLLQRAAALGVGATVLEAVRRTRAVTAQNTNLGMLLLLAPLAAAVGRSETDDLRGSLTTILQSLSRDDAQAVYEAIRMARPGGLGTVPQQDVSVDPTGTLSEVMALAAERDLVARQYTNGFHEVFQEIVPALRSSIQDGKGVERAIVEAYLRTMAQHPDSLIARKRGTAEAREASRRAAAVLEAGWTAEAAGHQALEKFDGWLRAEGNARNPGTTADLVTAGLFVALHTGIIEFPLHW
jgi:triphosphoribosyl-dephospho-CoA synthase